MCAITVRCMSILLPSREQTACWHVRWVVLGYACDGRARLFMGWVQLNRNASINVEDFLSLIFRGTKR